MQQRTISLTWLVALLSAGIAGVFMVVHDAFLGNLGADGPTLRRLLSHGWHLAIYFAVIFAFMYLVLHRLLVRPIQDLYVKLYALTKGDRQRIEISSPVSEVQEIAGGINLLISRPERVFDRTLTGKLRHECQVIRGIAHQLDERSPGSHASLLKLAERLDALADTTLPQGEDG